MSIFKRIFSRKVKTDDSTVERECTRYVAGSFAEILNSSQSSTNHCLNHEGFREDYVCHAIRMERAIARHDAIERFKQQTGASDVEYRDIGNGGFIIKGKLKKNGGD